MLWAKAINYIQAFNPLIIHGVSVVLVPTEVTRHPCSLESLSIDSIYFSFPENLTGDQCETHFWVSGSEVKQEDIRSQTEFDWQHLKNTLSLYCESTENGSYIGIVHPKMKMRWTCTHSQAIQDVDKFVSSLEQIWRNAWHHLLTNGSSVLNGCHQNESPSSW